MERGSLHCRVDRSSNTLAAVGLFTRIPREECVPSAMDGKFTLLGS